MGKITDQKNYTEPNTVGINELSTEASLLFAVKNDDVKAFKALSERAQSGAYRLGRFPTLSLMYLYKANKLLSVYEEKFLKVNSYEPLNEPMEISRKFSAYAGKRLRLYFHEIVTPAEMLLILDKTKHLKTVYPILRPSNAVKARLKSIYFIKYSLNVKFVDDEIIIDKRPLSYGEKKKIALACICVFVSLIIVIGVPVTAVSLIPKPVEGEVKLLKQIDFESTKSYTLTQDIVIPDSYSVKQVNCTITGGGYKLILGNGATLGELNGKISAVTFETSGTPVFSAISPNSTVKNIVVNVNAELEATEGTGFLAVNNYGTVENATVNVKGKLNVKKDAENESDELFFGGLACNNNIKYNQANQTFFSGKIKNCTVNFSDFKLTGETSANAAFGGIAGVNNGSVQGCTATGRIEADTFDIGGICSTNNGSISDCVNESDIFQVSAETSWNPIACGIVMTNTDSVENCENKGSVTAKSVCPSFETSADYESIVSASGIAYLNRGSTTAPKIKGCVNSGDVKSEAAFRDVFATGVCISTNGTLDGCKNTGKVDGTAGNGKKVTVAGISAVTYGNVTKSANYGELNAMGEGEAYIGGVAARLCAQINSCLSEGLITAKAKTVYAGGIFAYGEVASSYIYVYCATAVSCISAVKLDITSSDGTTVYVGGIAGYIAEQGFKNNDGSVSYFGGGVTDSYFVGEFVKTADYCGGIVGVGGANTYESNSYLSGATEYHNYDGNAYVSDSISAFGALNKGEDAYISAADKGAASDTAENIKNTEGYKTIISAIG